MSRWGQQLHDLNAAAAHDREAEIQALVDRAIRAVHDPRAEDIEEPRMMVFEDRYLVTLYDEGPTLALRDEFGRWGPPIQGRWL